MAVAGVKGLRADRFVHVAQLGHGEARTDEGESRVLELVPRAGDPGREDLVVVERQLLGEHDVDPRASRARLKPR
jgi:hypothetical protein